MEVAGLALGIVGLFSVCKDVLEYVDAYTGFEAEAQFQIALFRADKYRLESWTKDVGLWPGAPDDSRDKRLQEPALVENLFALLQQARSTWEATEIKTDSLRIKPLQRRPTLKAMLAETSDQPKPDSKWTKSSIRGGLAWIFKDKVKLTTQINRFHQTVDQIYAVVPPANDGKESDSKLMTIERDLERLLKAMEQKTIQETLDSVLSWLNMTNFDKTYGMSQFYDTQVSSMVPDTCEWIFDKIAYQDWTENKGRTAQILWINGGAGCGKTMLCTKLVQTIRVNKLGPCAYYFSTIHANTTTTASLSIIIRYWLSQLVSQNTNVLSLVKSLSEKESSSLATDTQVWSALASTIRLMSNTILVLDGFDEYPRQDDVRRDFLIMLKQCIAGTGTRILVTCRPESDIKAELSESAESIEQLDLREHRILPIDVQGDNVRYARSIIDKKLTKKSEELKIKFTNLLASRSDGMFQWIKMQQQELQRYKNNAIALEAAIDRMPRGLSSTYERNWLAIQKQDPEDQARALAILRWTISAQRPLTVSEVSDAVAMDLSGDDPELSLETLPDEIDDEYIADAIVDICGSLVEVREGAKNSVPGTWTINVIHPSVREFLLSALPIFPDLIENFDFATAEKLAKKCHDAYLFKICLAFLEKEDIAEVKPEYGPRFTGYAELNWHLHLNREFVDDATLDRLFQAYKNNNVVFQRWADHVEPVPPDNPSWVRGSGLYFATLLDLPRVANNIIEDDKDQLNITGGVHGTPLNIACANGNHTMYALLKNAGADLNLKGGTHGSALIAAVSAKNIDIVSSLVNAGIDQTLVDSKGQTALFVAASTGQLDIAKMLQIDDTIVNRGDAEGRTPLYAACGEGHLEMARLLLEEGADISIVRDTGRSALGVACYKGTSNKAVVQLLLDNGAAVTTEKEPPLRLAALGTNPDSLEIAKMLLEKGADVSAQSVEDGATAILCAAQEGHYDLVKLLLDHSNVGDIEKPMTHGVNPLCAAVMANHTSIVELLLDSGADVYPENEKPLFWAARYGYVDCMKLLLEKTEKSKESQDVETPTKADQVNDIRADGWSSLAVCASHGHIEAAKLLVSHGALVDPVMPESSSDAPPRKYMPALVMAAMTGDMELVRYFVEDLGADVHRRDLNDCHALFRAALGGHLEIVQYLLSHGTVEGLEVASEEGLTTLHAGIESGNVDLVRCLLERGANIYAVTKDGRSTLYKAVGDGKENFLEILRLLLDAHSKNPKSDPGFVDVAGPNAWAPLMLCCELEWENAENDTTFTDSGQRARETYLAMAKMLVAQGADVSARNSEGWPPLMICARHNSLDIMKYLLDFEAVDINAANSGGFTALMVACEHGYGNIVNALLAHGKMSGRTGVNINQQNNIGETALTWGAYKGQRDIVEALLEHGADHTILENEGFSSLYWSVHQNHLSTAKLLLEKGADPNLKTETDWSPLRCAVSDINKEMIDLLLSYGAKINDAATIFSEAATKGDVKMIETLLKTGEYDLMQHGAFSRSLLHLAAWSGDLECVNFLLERGLTCSGEDIAGLTVLDYACMGGSLEVFQRLQILDPSLTYGKKSRWSPLHFAYRTEGSERLVDWLHENGWEDTKVETEVPKHAWSPIAIGVFYGAVSPDKLPAEDSGKVNGLTDVGSLKTENYCDYCLKGIREIHFSCEQCQPISFDLCFMCYIDRETLHPGHTWKTD